MVRAKMTPAEFTALRPSLGRLAADTIEIARAVLVDGMTQAGAAAHYGMTRQRIYGILQRFQAAAQAVPTNWRKVEVWLPPDLADQVEEMAERARVEHQASDT